METPLVEQIAEADRLMEHLLPGLVCIDEDALFSSQDDHSMSLDTSIWGPGADDSSRLSAQEDNIYTSASISHSFDDLTPQQSGDTSEDSHVLAPRNDELPKGAVTHLSPVQTSMIATSHEEIIGTLGMMDELSVRDAHHGQIDPQI